MSAINAPDVPLTMADVMADLDVGRSAPHAPADRLVALRSHPRPILGGPRFVTTLLGARLLGRVHPRLARRALLRLWLTPWTHPSARRPVTDLHPDLRAWSLRHGDVVLRGFAGGTGPTVVLVHGWAGRAADWRHLAAALIGGGWRVVAPDLPAHGATEGDTTDLFALGAAAAAVLRHERPAAVVAHSLGFPVTLQALEQGAPTPDALVALAPGRRMRQALDRFTSQAGLGVALRDELDAALRRDYGDDVWDVLDVDRALPDLPMPGLVVHDADDADVPQADGVHIAHRWPGASFTATQGLGHRRILRDPHVHDLVRAALR